VKHRAIPVTRELAPGAARAIADGFFDNEIWVWMIPGDWRRERLLPRHYEAMINRVFIPRGGAWTTEDGAGGALWLPPDTHKLSEPGLERADADRLPAYLETQRESNIPFYRRFGFELVEKISLGDSPPLWTMWREAR